MGGASPSDPGDAGTVVRHDEATGTVDIAWDSGSRLSMYLDAGDRIHRRPHRTAVPHASNPSRPGRRIGPARPRPQEPEPCPALNTPRLPQAAPGPATRRCGCGSPATVAVALRRQVGDDAADAFNTAAHACGTYQQVLDLVRATVRTR